MMVRTENYETVSAHFVALANIARTTEDTDTGVLAAVGSHIYAELRRIERAAHRTAERYCNGEIDESIVDRNERRYIERIGAALNGHIPDGLFINRDPRGYALKIDSSTEYVKYRDFGGYQILAPEFN